MTGKVEVLVKVIAAANLTITELGDLINQVDTLFWDETAKQAKELTE